MENDNVGGLHDWRASRGDSKLPARVENSIGADKRSKMEKKAVPYLKNKEVYEKRKNTTKPVFLSKSEGAMRELTTLRATGGVVVMKANGNPTIKDYVEALKNMCSSYKDWNWNPIPIDQGILFQFPSLGGLELLSKRSVIACKNGHFTVKRLEEDKRVKKHNFPVKLAVLAFNLPPFLRAEQEIAKMIEGFAYLIEAEQLYEDGGPMKLTVGCRSSDEIPRELAVVFGGMEYKVALAVRETEPKRSPEDDGARPKDTRKRNFTYFAPEFLAGKKKEENKENRGFDAAKGAGDAGGDAQSLTVPENRSGKISFLGQARFLNEKGSDSPSSLRIKRSKDDVTGGIDDQAVVDPQNRKMTDDCFVNGDEFEGEGGSSHGRGGRGLKACAWERGKRESRRRYTKGPCLEKLIPQLGQ